MESRPAPLTIPPPVAYLLWLEIGKRCIRAGGKGVDSEVDSRCLSARRQFPLFVATARTGRLWRWVLRLSLAAAVAASAYLAWASLAGGTLAGCSGLPQIDCQQALNGRWSRWWSIPVSIPGFLTYAAMLLAAACLGPQRTPAVRRAAWLALRTAGHAGLRCGGVVLGLDGDLPTKNSAPGVWWCMPAGCSPAGWSSPPSSASKVCRGSTRALASGLTGRSCCRGPGRIDSRAVLGVAPADAPRGTPERRGPREFARPMRQETPAGGRPARPMPKRLKRSGLFPSFRTTSPCGRASAHFPVPTVRRFPAAADHGTPGQPLSGRGGGPLRGRGNARLLLPSLPPGGSAPQAGP